jgi:hypothetical protein
MIFPVPLCASPLQFTTIDISLWISAYTCHSHDHSSSLLLLRDASKYSSLSWKSLSYCLAVLSAWKTLAVNSSHLSRICSSRIVHVLRKNSLEYFRSSENPPQLIALGILVCLHYGQFLMIICLCWPPRLCHFEPNDSMCGNARSHQVITLNYPSGSDVIPDMSWFSTIQTFIDCPN